MRARPGALSLSKGALLAVLLTAPLLASCSPAPAAPPTPATPPPMSSTPELAAKKKAAAGAAKPKSAAEPERKNIISIRGTESWREWLTRYAASRRVPVTSLIDQVLAEAAKRDGFESPPER